MRASHAANNGRIFAWDNPPETGHPGEDYGCRCTEEAYTGIIPPEILQRLRNAILDYLARTKPWGNLEMSLHFFIGNGAEVNLESIGHEKVIRDYYEKNYEAYTGIIPPEILQRLRNAILDYLARTKPWGNLEMSLHFFIGNGAEVNLESIGHEKVIRDYYEKNYLYRFEEQILKKAANAPIGKFEDDFEASYDFLEVIYSYRKSEIQGVFFWSDNRG